MNTQPNTSTTKVFSLFNANGAMMQEIKPIENLPIGCIIYSYGYGMSQKFGAIVEKNINGTYKGVYTDGSGFFTLDRYSRPHSEKFGIGHYYDDSLKCIDDGELATAIENAKISETKKAEAIQEQNRKDNEEKQNLPKIYPHLTVNHSDDDKITKINLVAELKKNFPSVKFSVKKRHYSSYTVSWTDGPTTEEVSKITGKFEDSESSICGDFRDYAPSNFNRVFGGFKYIFECRGKSDSILNLLPKVKELTEKELHGEYPEAILHRIFSRYSIPTNAKNFDILRNSKNSANSIDGFYDLVWEVEEVKEQKQTVKNTDSVSISFNEQKNGIEIKFDSKPENSTLTALKANGFRWSKYQSIWYAVKTPARIEFVNSL